MYYIVDEDLYEHVDVVLNGDEWNDELIVRECVKLCEHKSNDSAYAKYEEDRERYTENTWEWKE